MCRVAPRILAALLIAPGIGFLLLGLATSIPVLVLTGAAFLLGAWAARPRALRVRGRATVFKAMIATLFAAAGSMAFGATAYVWWHSQPPGPDAFYSPPAVLPPAAGSLVRQEPYTRTVPSDARAWRILYTTTRSHDVATVASALVLAPAALPDGPRPVIMWTHGTTGTAPGCAPSVFTSPFEGNVPALAQIVTQGWVVVLPDYAGLGTSGPHPYLIGEGEARSALDAVRAARQMKELTLHDRTIVWGHSQGGHAALWTGMIAPAYAPDVNVIGVAALSPATDLAVLANAVKETPVGKIVLSFIVTAYSAAYPDVRLDDYVGPRSRARAMASRCLGGPGGLLSGLTALTMERAFFAHDPASGPLGARLAENTPRGPIPAALLIAQGGTDRIVHSAMQDRFMRDRCDAGQDFDYWTYAGRDHDGLVAADSPLAADLMRWTRDVISGVPPVHGCHTVAR